MDEKTKKLVKKIPYGNYIINKRADRGDGRSVEVVFKKGPKLDIIRVSMPIVWDTNEGTSYITKRQRDALAQLIALLLNQAIQSVKE